MQQGTIFFLQYDVSIKIIFASNKKLMFRINGFVVSPSVDV